MKAHLIALWESRSPRERWVLTIVGGAFLALLYGTVVASGTTNRARLQASVAMLRTDAIRLAQRASEVSRLRAALPRASSVGEVVEMKALLEDRIGAAGLSLALVTIEASDAHRAVVAFNAVGFADWTRLLVSLQARHVRLDACRVDGLPTPGMVKVTATFSRNIPP